MRKLFVIMEISSNICSLRDAPLSRLFSVSGLGLGYSYKVYSKIIGILGTVGLQKIGYFSVMKYFWVIISSQSVRMFNSLYLLPLKVDNRQLMDHWLKLHVNPFETHTTRPKSNSTYGNFALDGILKSQSKLKIGRYSLAQWIIIKI